MGSLGVLRASLTEQTTRFEWSITIFGTVISIWGNIAAYSTGLQNISEFLSQALPHALPPLSLALSLELFLRIWRHRITASRLEELQAQETTEQKAATESTEPAYNAPEAPQGVPASLQDSQPHRSDSTHSEGVSAVDVAEAENATSEPTWKESPSTRTQAPQGYPESTEPARQRPETVYGGGNQQEASQARKSDSVGGNGHIVDRHARFDEPLFEERVATPAVSAPTAPTSTNSSANLSSSIASNRDEQLEGNEEVQRLEELIVDLPSDTTDTDKVLAIIQEVPKPSSRSLAVVLGKELDDRGKKAAYRTLERARKKQEKQVAGV